VLGDDGVRYDIYWAEADYLVRVGSAAPELVVDILLRLKASNNAWVRRSVFTIGSRISADQAARLKPLLKSWGPSGFGWRTDPREMASFAINLLANGQHAAGVWLSNVLFGPRAPLRDSGNKSSSKPALFLDDHWYELGLSDVVTVLQESDLEMVVGWLAAYERFSGLVTESRDASYLSRDAIRVRGGLRARIAPERALIEGTRDLALRAVLHGPEQAVAILAGGEMALTHKIALFSIADALSSAGTTQNIRTRLLAVAAELLFDDKSRDHPYRIEYGELARSVAAVDSSVLLPLEEFLARGPLIAIDELRRRVRQSEDESEEQIEAHLHAYFEEWRRKWLSSIGNDALPPALRVELRELEAKLGAIDDPLNPATSLTSWTGPNSPVPQEEVALMSGEELASYLESWHATGDGWGPEPSHEGLARELSALLTTNPLALARIQHLVSRLRPTYLRAIVDGWSAALKAGIPLDWEQAVDVVQGVLEHSDISSFQPEGDEFDDDRSYRGAKEAAVGLLDEILKRRDDHLVPGDFVEIFANILLVTAADEASWDEYNANSALEQTDPLTISLNMQWTTRLHAIVGLLSHGPTTKWYDQARDEFEREIARPDRHGASRAADDSSLGRLLNADSEWIEQRVPEFFGGENQLHREQQIALSTALATHTYHQKLFELLGGGMVAALGLNSPMTVGWATSGDPLQRIGEWVVSAIAIGDSTLEDSVASAFFANAEPAIRGAALGEIAWSLINVDDVDPAVLSRLGDLWDARADHVREFPDDRAELQDFYWFVRCRKYPPSWWLPRLRQAVELSKGSFSTKGMIGKELALAATSDPREAFDALESLLEQPGGSTDFSRYDLSQRAAPHVIASALESDDPALRNDATEFMNRLGASGYVTLEARVIAVRNGTAAELEDD
jgi:hypothetical protein